MKWYKRDPDAALAGMVGLTPEERGIYNTVIDMLYSRNGELPTDDNFFCRACECRPQMWRRVRDSLIAKGKMRYRPDGKLTANRVEKELESARKLIAKGKKTTSKPDLESDVSSGIDNKNNDSGCAEQETTPPVRAGEQPQPLPEKKEKEMDGSRAREPSPSISPEAHNLAGDFLTAIGVDRENPELCGFAGTQYQAQIWVSRGYQRDMILAVASNIAARAGPRKPLNYFATAIESAANKPAPDYSNAQTNRDQYPNKSGRGGFGARVVNNIRESPAPYGSGG